MIVSSQGQRVAHGFVPVDINEHVSASSIFLFGVFLGFALVQDEDSSSPLLPP